MQTANVVNIISSQTTRFIYSLSFDEEGQYTRLGLDNHPDMSVLGQDAVIHEIIEGSQCNVKPFCDSYKAMQNVNMVNGYLAFDTLNGSTYTLEVNQALDFSSQMKHSILCTNQTRANQVIFDYVPKFPDITKQSRQAVIFPEDNVELDINMKGPVPYLNVRKPTQ